MKKRKSIYILTALHYECHLDGKEGHYLKNKDEEIKCYQERIGIFSNVKKAEEVISFLVKQAKDENEKWGGWETYFGFVLDECYLDDPYFYFETSPHKDEYKNISHFESRRTYLSNGTLNCFSDIDERGEKKFVGRKEPIKHIEKGDLAILWCGNSLVPILVGELPFTKEEWKKRFNSKCCGDYTDDSGVVFDIGLGHEHPFSPNVFPTTCLPYFKLSVKTLKKLEKNRDKYYKYE